MVFDGIMPKEVMIFGEFWVFVADIIILYFCVKSFADREISVGIMCLVMFLIPIWLYIESSIYAAKYSS